MDVNSKTYQPVLNTLLRSSMRRQPFDGKATRQSRYSVTTAIATRSINEDWTMPDLLQLSRFLDEAKDLLPRPLHCAGAFIPSLSSGSICH